MMQRGREKWGLPSSAGSPRGRGRASWVLESAGVAVMRAEAYPKYSPTGLIGETGIS